MVNIAEQVGEKASEDWLYFYGDFDGIYYGVELNFLFSSWGCIYGNGCPSIIYEGDTTYTPHTGCCTDGAYMDSREDYERTQAWSKRLTEEDLEPKQLADLRKNGWAVVRKDNDDEFVAKTRVRDGSCIFNNRGSSAVDGKIGCAFLHLAARLTRTGVESIDHTLTMPYVCWQLPFKRMDTMDEDGNLESRLLYPWHVGDWYGSGEDEGTMKWWCVDDAAAYKGKEPVFRTARNELEKLLGEDNYKQILPELERRYALKYVAPMRPAMPDGRTLIPLAIKGLTERPRNK